MTRVKVCGIRDLETALLAIQLGAHALGFIFYERSVRNIAPGDASDIIKNIPAYVGKVGVFVDKSPDDIMDILYSTGIDTIQLSGDQDRAFIEKLTKRTHLPITLTIRVDQFNKKLLKRMNIEGVNSYLIDKYHQTEYGGTGERVDLMGRFTQKEKDFISRRLILAGGVNRENIGEIISGLRPYAVDLSSGLEKIKGIKDRELLKEFFEEYHACLADLSEK